MNEKNLIGNNKNIGEAVILLSGGLDSAVTGAIAREKGFKLVTLTVDYGQRHRVEVERAERVARMLGTVHHVVLKMDLRSIGGSSLTDDIPVPRGGTNGSIPSTYVPARNTVFLALALGLAEVRKADDIFIGVNSVDYSGYPDCRPEFIEAFSRLAALATKRGVEGNVVRINAPLSGMSKADIIRRGYELGVDFSLTHSCYNPAPDGSACGVCDSCLIRKEGFISAGVPDPTRYVSS